MTDDCCSLSVDFKGFFFNLLGDPFDGCVDLNQIIVLVLNALSQELLPIFVRIHNEFWRERNSYAEVQTNAALKNLKRTITTSYETSGTPTYTGEEYLLIGSCSYAHACSFAHEKLAMSKSSAFLPKSADYKKIFEFNRTEFQWKSNILQTTVGFSTSIIFLGSSTWNLKKILETKEKDREKISPKTSMLMDNLKTFWGS